jgi:recombinational DNA repair protein (RecF pathway)
MVDERRAFVLGRRVLRESDLGVTLLLEDGVVADAWAPSGQASQRRFAAGLSPQVLFRVGLREHRRGLRLEHAVVEQAWPGLLTVLHRQSAAAALTGAALELCPHAGAHGHGFLLLGDGYQRLATAEAVSTSATLLVALTFELLADAGHGLSLDRCARCHTPAPEHRRVTVDPGAGGVRCRACGGGPHALSAPDRAALRAVMAGDGSAWRPALLGIAARLLADAAPATSATFERLGPLLGQG